MIIPSLVPDTLDRLGRALLANVVEDLVDAGLPVPVRQVFSHGEVVRDCNQVAVTIVRVETGVGGHTIPRPAAGATHMPVTHLVTWGVDVAVCAAESSGLVSAVDVTFDGSLGSRYEWVLTRSLTHRWARGLIFSPYVGPVPGGRGLVVTGTTGGMDGALVAVTASLTVFTTDEAALP